MHAYREVLSLGIGRLRVGSFLILGRLSGLCSFCLASPCILLGCLGLSTGCSLCIGQLLRMAQL